MITTGEMISMDNFKEEDLALSALVQDYFPKDYNGWFLARKSSQYNAGSRQFQAYRDNLDVFEEIQRKGVVQRGIDDIECMANVAQYLKMNLPQFYTFLSMPEYRLNGEYLSDAYVENLIKGNVQVPLEQIKNGWGEWLSTAFRLRGSEELGKICYNLLESYRNLRLFNINTYGDEIRVDVPLQLRENTVYLWVAKYRHPRPDTVFMGFTEDNHAEVKNHRILIVNPDEKKVKSSLLP